MAAEPLPARGWQWPRYHPRSTLLLLALLMANGLWQGNTVYLSLRGDGSAVSWGKPYLWELTGHFAGFLCGYIPYAATTNAPRPRGRWGRFLLIHASAGTLFAVLVPFLFLGMRYALYPLLGWGAYHYGPLALRLPMEWQKLLLAYAIACAGIAFLFQFRDNRAKERREAELQVRLREARLQALAAQLDPHFLFNALNTISSEMYESLDHTDHLLASLGQMLRDGLDGGSALWPLAREQAHLEAFLDFTQARFGERMQATLRMDPGLAGALVPRFCLQRLVENALKHNLDARAGAILRLEIEAERTGDRLRMAVLDNGVGFRGPALEEGVGLGNLREVLALSYGAAGHLELGNRPGGGARVVIELPMEPAHG
jgi:hypothetical protein